MSKIDYGTQVTTLRGQDKDLAEYQGKVLLIVNTASKCGFTPQYEGLERVYKQYHEQGLEVLGFPCNQFGHQEPGSEEEIASFCQLNYGVSFPMHAKIDVNGDGTHPLYSQLKSAQKGILGTEAIKWNFTKFLVAKDGEVVGRYSPRTTPEELSGDIEREIRK